MAEPTKVVIVGAGWNGLMVAKTYLKINPAISLTILEAERTLGGTWSGDRVYPEFHTQVPYGRYESCDFPMTRPPAAPRAGGDFIPSLRVHEYLVEFAQRFNIADKITYNTSVEHIQRHEDGKGWKLDIRRENGEREVIICDKLVVATGVHSLPNVPDIPTSTEEPFVPLSFHSRYVGRHYDDIRSPSVNVVTIYGGGKSAYDAAQVALNAGKHVHWVIRTSGSGAGALALPEINGKPATDMLFTPAMEFNNPHPMRNTWWDWFFHSGGSRIGYWLHWAVAGLASRMMLSKWRYDEGVMKNLKPPFVDRIYFWHNSSVLALPGPELIDKVRNEDGITIHRADITRLSGRTIHLANGTTLETDILIYATGYNIHHTTFSERDSWELGLPVRIDRIPVIAPGTSWPTESMERADQEVLQRFPRLKSTCEVKKPTWTQYRMYRYILPFELLRRRDRSLAFVGYMGGGTIIGADVSALWAVAWMEGKLEITRDFEEMIKESEVLNAFLKRRYINASQEAPYLPFDGTVIIREMMKELDVPHPNLGAWTPHFPSAYRGIVETWLAKHT
ncbi:SubName: Full=Related to dimethylaniline monooxygenase {ECO:0000313/EMBL:CCA70769.1} [Serendipita indica DSM 11827]|nr:SubName: Full=Related to dimethylaniline monooxygenase {ECO:0000313/EMBL:CCA70769.1} [Serendipita indica DSM 11827]